MHGLTTTLELKTIVVVRLLLQIAGIPCKVAGMIFCCMILAKGTVFRRWVRGTSRSLTRKAHMYSTRIEIGVAGTIRVVVDL